MNVLEWSSKSRARATQGKRSTRRPMPKPHETEEEAIIRRFHDAQRMARFRARKKQALEEARALETARLAEISLISELKRRNISFQMVDSALPIAVPDKYEACVPIVNNPIFIQSLHGQNKYSQLLRVIQELGKDIKLSYAGSRSAAERLKAGIVQARMLIKDCLAETELNSRQ